MAPFEHDIRGEEIKIREIVKIFFLKWKKKTHLFKNLAHAFGLAAVIAVSKWDPAVSLALGDWESNAYQYEQEIENW